MQKKIFVCSPYRGDTEKNLKVAKFAARIIVKTGHIPVAPHLYFPLFLDDEDKNERMQGIKLGAALLRECDRLWLIGPTVTRGMEFELAVAKETQIPVELYDEKLACIDPETVLLDDRVDDRFRSMIAGLNLKAVIW